MSDPRNLWRSRCLYVKLWRFAWVLGFLFSTGVSAQVQVNQVFNLQGPSPSTGVQTIVQSGELPPTSGSVVGAVQAVVFDPANSNIYVGTPGGGIWVSTNGGSAWTALTDNKASLAIDSLSLDPTDASGKTLIAGTGVTSNGSIGAQSDTNQIFQGRGGIQNGLLYSQNGGQTWTTLGSAALAGQNVTAVAARGQIIMAGTSNATGFAFDPSQLTVGALYRSVNGGTTFSPVSGAAGTGLPAGPITSLVGDSSNPNKFYAAVTSPTVTSAGYASTAIYMSTNAGATWTQVFNASNSTNFNGHTTITGNDQTMIKLATGPDGAVAAGIIDLSTRTVTGLFWSNNPGTASGSWTAVKTPTSNTLNLLNQVPENFAIAIDPSNSKLIYVSGDETSKDQTTYALPVYRISVTDQTITSLSLGNTASNSFAHSNSRAITFDASGNLILTSDGGIYLRTSPQTSSGDWQQMNGNLSAFEVYKTAYDAVSKRLVVAGQDNGVAIQSSPGSVQWNAVQGADGLNVMVNDRTLAGESAIYATNYNFANFTRIVLNANGTEISPDTGNWGYGAKVTCNNQNCANFSNGGFWAPVILNKADPTRIAMADNTVYVTQDTLTGAQAPTVSTVNLQLTNLGSPGSNSSVTALAYGTSDNNNVLLAGVSPNGYEGGGAGQLWISTTAAANSLVVLPAFTSLNAFSPTSIVFDQRSQNRFYVADGNQLFGTSNQGASFQNFTTALPTSFIRPTALEFINNNGVNALLVGGLNNVDNAQSPIVVADSNNSGNLSGWRFFGQGLPNSPISALSYNAAVDVLAVGTFGRGVAALYDVTSYFKQATVLQFGLANNNSQPDASYLTDGTNLDGSTFVRPLNKYGTGTLMIAGNAGYTGGTTIFGGVMMLGNGGAGGGSILGNVAFCSDATNPLCDTSTNKALAFNRSDTYAFGGVISGPGQLYQIGTGTTVLTGASTYTGPTFVDAGTLEVDGSIANSSSVTVNAGGTLSGTGIVDPVTTTIMSGGTLAPGNATNPTGTLTITGNLAFQSGAIYLVGVTPTAAASTNISGTASLAGTVAPMFASGSYAIGTRYDILHSAGLGGTTFGGVSAPNFNVSLSYSVTDAFLTFNGAALGNTTSVNQNQQNVANAINNFFNGGGALPSNFFNLFGLTGGALATALGQLDGEVATGAERAAFQLDNQFLTLMLDPFVNGRGNTALGGAAIGFAPEQEANLPPEIALAYASILTKAPPRGFEQRWTAWGSAYGGTSTTNGDPVVGSNNVRASTFGFAGGMDYHFAPNTVAGFALAGAGTNWGLANAIGTGRSDALQVGAYGSHWFGPAYVAGALAFSNHWFTTNRSALGDQLNATFTGQNFGARIEGGYRYWALPAFAVTPYGAVQAQTFHTPAYSETDATGGGFGLNNAAMNATDVRTELGARFDDPTLVYNKPLILFGRLAWAHDFVSNPALSAAFQALPGGTFTVNGAPIPHDSALTTAGAQLFLTPQWTLLAKFEGEFARSSQTYAGTGTLRYTW